MQPAGATGIVESGITQGNESVKSVIRDEFPISIEKKMSTEED